MQKLSTAAAFFLVFVPVTAASAESLIPVRLQVAGAEVRGSVPPVWDGKEWHAPLEVLDAVGLRGEVKGRGSTLSLKSAGRSGELRLTRRTGQPMLRLTELARFLDADIRRPARLLKDGEPAPVKPGDWVYLLARVRTVRVADGTVRIDTSFPVLVRTGVDENSERLEDVLECVGATLPEGFAPAPVPEGETRVRSVSVVEQKPGLVRVTLGLKDTVSTCAPGEQKEAPGEQKEAPGEQKEPPPVEPLRLDDVLRQVQAYYPKLSAADAERRIAAAKRLEKEGAFDPRFYSGSDVSRFPSDTPGSLKSFNTSEAGLELLTPYGIKVITGGRINRGDVKSPLSPTGESGEYFVGLKVPLFGGAGINEKLAALRQSRLGVPLADTEFHEFRLDVLLKAAVTYWDWAAAGQRLQVAKDLLELAQVRAKAVKDRADAGDLPLIDVAEANQEVQRRVEGLEKAQRDLQKEMFKLSLFLWEPDGSPRALPSARPLRT
ncbi:MAG TPA: TolC family protein, partial [Armatimonadota bacterium]|nr:TolC family protein [Armatimonadota bacterium]